MAPASVICVVDDDESVRESLPSLLAELGYEARTFSSAEEFLASGAVDEARALILDIAMPGMSGPELQRKLRLDGKTVPIIIITGQTDAILHASVLAEGAVACLVKPFAEQALINALAKVLRAAG